MNLDLREELHRAVDASPQPPHDRAGDLPRGRARLRRRRALAVASVVPVTAAVVAAAALVPRTLDPAPVQPPAASRSTAPSLRPSADPSSPPSTSPAPSASHSPHHSAPPSLRASRSPLPSAEPTPPRGWHQTQGSLVRAVERGLDCRVFAGEQVFVCNGSTQGKAAVTYWNDSSGVSFGDPAHADHRYAYAHGATRPATPSEVWAAIGTSLVGGPTSHQVTTWLRTHHTGSTVIHGLLVEIDGPIGGVSAAP